MKAVFCGDAADVGGVGWMLGQGGGGRLVVRRCGTHHVHVHVAAPVHPPSKEEEGGTVGRKPSF